MTCYYVILCISVYLSSPENHNKNSHPNDEKIIQLCLPPSSRFGCRDVLSFYSDSM